MSKIGKLVLVIGWIILVFLGGAGIVERVLHGHHSAAYGSYVVWGLWVSAYIYFIGLSAGAFLLSSLIYVFGVTRLERIGKLSLFVAVITLFMALISIWLDLGRMERFYRVFTSPNFGSMMTWMVWLYTLYFILLLIELWLVLRPELAAIVHEKSMRGLLARLLAFAQGPLSSVQQIQGRSLLKKCAIAGVPLAILFHGGVGALFGTVSARPFWHNSIAPILFLTGALVSGGGLMTFVMAAFWPNRDSLHRQIVSLLGRVVLGLLLLDIMLEWAEFSIPMWYGVGHEYFLLSRVLFGEFWYVFWVFHIGLGTVVPAILLIGKKDSPWAVGLAGLLIAITFMAVRLNIVIPGLIEPQLQGLQTAFVDKRLVFAYVPSFFEWQVTFGIAAVGIAIFYLGFHWLPLTSSSTEIKKEH